VIPLTAREILTKAAEVSDPELRRLAIDEAIDKIRQLYPEHFKTIPTHITTNSKRSKFTAHEVETIRLLHDSGMGYRKIAEKYDTVKSTIQSFCTHRRR
jgi:predicted DNA-binding protein (UPF0251 family)